MLVLTRKEDESLLIFPSDEIDPDMTVTELFNGGPIRITINKISSQVQIGIEAPQGLTVLREELNSDKFR